MDCAVVAVWRKDTDRGIQQQIAANPKESASESRTACNIGRSRQEEVVQLMGPIKK